MAPAKTKPPTSYLAPALCLKGQPCVIHGPFSGNSTKTFAAVEERPARIVAETSDAAYVAIPERTEAGLRPLVIAEGAKAVAFPSGRRGVQPGSGAAKFIQGADAVDLPGHRRPPGTAGPVVAAR